MNSHQSVVDQIVRNRIYSNIYWKERLAGVNAEDIIDRMIEIKYAGGTYGGNRKPTKFLCIVLKLLQMGLDKKIIYKLIENDNYKYIRLIGLFYLRLVGSAEEVYTTCEKMLADYRKVILRLHDGSYEVVYMDDVVDDMMRKEIMFDVVLPRLTKRHVLEDMGKLESKRSVLEDEIEKMIEENKDRYDVRSRSRSKEKKKKDEGSVDDEESGEEGEKKKSKKEKKKKRKLKKMMKEQKKKDKEHKYEAKQGSD